jgi:flagellar biosynthesis GTPase FlhF
VAGSELLDEAVAQLYASDLDVFTELRGVLAARARAAGDAPAAKAIAGLRKPTRSAWVINQLVRADPSVASRLVALGDELRAAEAALDGARIRELSRARRQLTSDLVRDALALSGPDPAPAALREEVTATLGAALADPQVAEQLAAGTLLRAAHGAGFGSGVGLALGPSAPGRSPAPIPAEPATPARPRAERVEAERAAAERAAAERAERERAERERAEAERAEREQAVAEAEQVAAGADRAAEAAIEAEREQESAVQRAEEQVAEARQRLAEARLQARRAKRAQREALEALGRLQIATSDSSPERGA